LTSDFIKPGETDSDGLYKGEKSQKVRRDVI